MSKYTGIISAAKDEATNQENGLPANHKTSKLAGQSETIEEVNLTVKVAKKRRQHWTAEAKRQGTSVTSVVLEALSNRFGEPEP